LLIEELGGRGRYFLSRELCRRWGWTQPDGRLKDVACRDILLRLEDKGLIELPARQRGAIRGARRRKIERQLALPDLLPSAGEGTFPDAIEWRLANRGTEALLYKDLLNAHHYLGFAREVGHCLRYIAYSSGRPMACLGWAAAAWKVGGRDQFIGWTHMQRQKNLHLVVNNTRYLILERIPHLASHLLAANVRRLAADWQAAYGYAPVLLETFVDTTRFRGTCYKAANWIHLGLTQGRGKYDRHTRREVPIKAVFAYPLRQDFRHILTHD
jgi:hypothetical protein